ncbi:MAG: hypothetical protein ACYC6L_07360 [Anaerolineae bacterium]
MPHLERHDRAATDSHQNSSNRLHTGDHFNKDDISSGSQTEIEVAQAPNLAQLQAPDATEENLITAQTILGWQQSYGNAYVQRYVHSLNNASSPGVNKDAADTKHGNPFGVSMQRQALALQRVPATTPQATQEAEAQQTQTLLTTATSQLLTQSDPTLRNTGRLFTTYNGQPARLGYTPMTLRSDNANLILTSGGTAADTAFYFYGPNQNNSHRFGPNTLGTIEDNNVVIRGKYADGTWRTASELMGTLAHEASHILVKSYGEHPGTATNAASFDRYKDEFRAYFIEPVGYFASLTGNAKVLAIRQQLIGTALNTGGYTDLNRQYWTQTGSTWADPTFRTQVDNHTAPDGFNQSNNPNLDRLFQLLNGIPRTSTVEAALTHIIRMTTAERAEAAASPLIQRLYRAVGGSESTRIEYALKFPVVASHATQLNPTNSTRVTAFLEAIALSEERAIKERYQQLTMPERSQAITNAALMVFMDRQLLDSQQRAAVYAMVVGGHVSQYDAMVNFLDACLEADVEGMLHPDMTEVPERVRTTLRSVSFRARLALYRLVEDARRRFVDVLVTPVRRRVLNALTEGGEP